MPPSRRRSSPKAPSPFLLAKGPPFQVQQQVQPDLSIQNNFSNPGGLGLERKLGETNNAESKAENEETPVSPSFAKFVREGERGFWAQRAENCPAWT